MLEEFDVEEVRLRVNLERLIGELLAGGSLTFGERLGAWTSGADTLRMALLARGVAVPKPVEWPGPRA